MVPNNVHDISSNLAVLSQSPYGFSADSLKQATAVMLAIWSVSTIVPFVNWGANNLLAF